MSTLEATPLTFTCPHCKTAVDVVPEHRSELVTCPNCSKPFQIAVPTATQQPARVEVPEDIRGTQEPLAQDPPRAQPDEVREAFASRKDKKAEPILSVRANLFRRYPGRFALYAVVILAGLYLLFDSIGGQYLFEMIGGVILVGWGLVRMIAWHWRGSSTTISVTPHSIILNRGLTDSIELLTEDVQTVQAAQDLICRLFGVGDLGIVTRGNMQNFLIRGVPDPESVVEAWRANAVHSPPEHSAHTHS